jgi:hypothetical protein
MSMYEMMFGSNGFARAAVLLPVLGVSDVGRFRDCWVEKDEAGEPIVVVYTRNGGGNRPDYAEIIERLQQHPLYVRDADDAFDCTYATFYFRCPPEYRDDLLAVAESEPVDTDERWQRAIAAIAEGLRPAPDGSTGPT